ncbi:hypothetical protein [Marinomonas flavescens]|nr:hypothetical protein [Marinomonas flavescens]
MPYDYLTTLFEMLPLLNDDSDQKEIDSLLPWNIK